MSTTYRTHVLQRAYLKRFRSSPGLIWQYDDHQRRWQKVSLKKRAGVVERFYPDHVEKWLATCIEQPALDGLEQLARAEKPLEKATELKLSVAYYLAVQLYRTPAALEERWGPAFAKALNRQKDKLGKDPLVDHLASLLSQVELDAERAGFAIPMTFAGKPLRDAVTEVVKSLLKFSWSVGIAPEGTRCVTTDDPIAPRRLPDGRKYFLFPLASQAILVGVETTDLSRVLDRVEVLEIPAADVRKYNSEMVAAARRYVYASRKETWVQRVRDKNRRT